MTDEIVPTEGPVPLVRWLLDTRYFDPEEGPALEGTFAEGDPSCRLLVIAGENASGKSLFRRLIGAACRKAEKTEKVEHIATSLEGKTRVGEAPWLAMVYGSEEWQATGANSGYLITGAIKTALGRTSPHIVTWDEPELGLSEGAQMGAGQAIAAFGREPGKFTRAAVVITHSRLLVRELEPLGPHFLYLGQTEPLSLSEWLRRPPVARSLEDLADASHARFLKVSKILKRSLQPCLGHEILHGGDGEVGVGVGPAFGPHVGVKVAEGIQEARGRAVGLVPVGVPFLDQVAPLLAVPHDGPEAHHGDGPGLDCDDLVVGIVVDPMLGVAGPEGDGALGVAPSVVRVVLHGGILPMKHLAVDVRPGVIVRAGIGLEPYMLAGPAFGAPHQNDLGLVGPAGEDAILEGRDQGGGAGEGAGLEGLSGFRCHGESDTPYRVLILAGSGRSRGMSRKNGTNEQSQGLRHDYDAAYFKTAKRPTEALVTKVGQIVEWTKYFLKSTGRGPTDPVWKIQGRVESVCDEGPFKGWPRVLWADADEPTLVNPVNLCFPGANRRRLE